MKLIERTYLGEVSLNYVEGPNAGPAVLLLHGTIARWQAWTPVLPRLVTGAHVFALDDRGYGKSGRSPDGRYGYLDFARDAEAFIREVIAEPAVVVGHSRGAMVALAVAAHAPDVVRGVVLQEPTLREPEAVGAPPTVPGPSRARDLLEAGGPVEALADELLALDPLQPREEALSRAENMLHMDVRALDAFRSGAMREGYDEWSLMRQLKCPAAFILGDSEAGSIVGETLLARAQQSIPDPRVLVVPGARHRVHLSNPEEFVDACLSFIASLQH